MIIALIIGSAIALFNILIAIIVNEWNIALILSGTVAVIAIVITSIIRNASLIFNRRSKDDQANRKSLMEIENIAKMITVFTIPHVLVTVVLFLKQYGIEFLLDKLKLK